jgi:hypothetical protein
VQVGARLRVDMQLAVGQLSEKVVVTGSSPLIETDSSQRSQVITGDQMRELALNGREYSALALLSTGVRQSALNKSTNGTPREGAFNVNGLRSTFNNFLIDGVDNNAYGTSNQGFSNQVMQPAPDAVSEFRVVTNNQSAEYGRAAGATVNVAYRSGANQFHGDAWEFFRDTKLNATTFFTPPDGQKPPLRRNQYGGVFGGPIVKNKAFFFADFEGFRQTRKNDDVLDAADRDAERRHPRRRHSRPAHRRRLPGRHGDSDDGRSARKVLGGLPAPNLAGAANNYSILQELTNDTDKAGGKIESAGEPGAVDVRPLRMAQPQHQRSAADPLPSGGGGRRQHLHSQQAARLGTTYVASDRSLLESPVRLVEHAGRQESAGARRADTFGITGYQLTPASRADLPSQGHHGYSAFGRQATNPQWQYPTVYNPKINYSWLMGKQSLKRATSSSGSTSRCRT